MRKIQLLLALTLSAAAPAMAESPLDPIPESQWTIEAAAHLLRRAGFGGTPSEIQALHARGLRGAIDHLVDYEKVPNKGLPHFVPKLTERPNYRLLRTKPEEERRKVQQAYRRKDMGQLIVLRAWWLGHMAATRHPLEEKMVLFWHGHFCSSQRDVRNSYHMYIQNATLRQHATGNFDKFVRAIARDPAMLEYLDNRVNRRQSPNENFARELMELFTMGVGNYTEKDIKEAARCFTGWTFGANSFRFVRTWHDTANKTLLGKTGDFDGDDVIDIIMQQPVTARYISGKLFRFFAHANPSEALIDQLAAGFRKDYQIKPLLKKLFASKEFYSERSVRNKIKGPIYLAVNLMRQVGADRSLSLIMANMAQKLGQSLMDPPNVKGWAGGRNWITTSLLLERYNAAQSLVLSPREMKGFARMIDRQMRRYKRRVAALEGQDVESMMAGPKLWPSMRNPPRAFDVLAAVKGAETAEQVVDRLCKRFLVVQPSAKLRATLIAYLGDQISNRDRLHGLLKLIVSTPEFQLS